MKRYQFSEFGLDALELVDTELPEPRPNEVRVAIESMSLNFRDLLVVEGSYNPKLPLPATPLSDAAGTVTAVGAEVENLAAGTRVVTHFVADWLDGPFDSR